MSKLVRGIRVNRLMIIDEVWPRSIEVVKAGMYREQWIINNSSEEEVQQSSAGNWQPLSGSWQREMVAGFE